MKTSRWILLILLCLLLAGTASASPAQDYAIDWNVTAGGGATLEQGALRLRNTLGQPATGQVSGGNATQCVGFWCSRSAEPQPVYIYLPLLLRPDVVTTSRR